MKHEDEICIRMDFFQFKYFSWYAFQIVQVNNVKRPMPFHEVKEHAGCFRITQHRIRVEAKVSWRCYSGIDNLE